MLCTGNVKDSLIYLDGITRKETVPSPFTSDPVLRQFCGNVMFDEGHYEVGLPRKLDGCKKKFRNNE